MPPLVLLEKTCRKGRIKDKPGLFAVKEPNKGLSGYRSYVSGFRGYGKLALEDDCVMFKVGDSVVYPSQGAGRVDEIATRVILGETHEYLKLSFVRGDMDVLVPLKKGQEVGLRHTIGEDQLPELWATLKRADLELPLQWPPRYRAEQEILAVGDAFSLARLISTLAQRDLDKGLAATEREVLENAKAMLASELAVVQNMSFNDAQRQLNETLEAHLEANA